MLHIEKEWVSAVESFFEKKSYIAVQAAFQKQFIQAPPFKKTKQHNITKYRLHGTSLNRNKENFGRQRTARSQESIWLVRNTLENNPKLRRICHTWQKCGKHVLCWTSSP